MRASTVEWKNDKSGDMPGRQTILNRQFSTVRAAVCTVLGLCALLGNAHAAMVDFMPGQVWRGFSQSTLSDASRGMVILGLGAQRGGSLYGNILLAGKWRQIILTQQLDGSVDVAGIGGDAGLKAHGNTTPTTDGGCFSRLTYQTGGSGDSLQPGDIHGLIGLLRTFPPGPVVNGVPADPYHTAFPPGPCDGMFMNAAGASGRMMLTHMGPAESGPPLFFTGDLMLQDIHFNMVGAISGKMLENGNYAVEMIGQSVNFSTVIPCIRVSAELMPAARPGDQAHLRGTYSVMNIAGNIVDRGSFDMAF